MPSLTYEQRRGELETYFDRTAADAWSRLTSNAPVSRIRGTVRAGRDRMRQTLLDWLPTDLRGTRVLDAGCGTGALAVEASRRGAEVVGVDLSPSLIALARERTPTDIGSGRLRFQVGDLLDPVFGKFDYVVAMDSLIHYPAADVVRVLRELTGRTRESVLFTFAPRTTALALMHAVGRFFPRSDRAPAIQPVGQDEICNRLACEAALASWRTSRTTRIASGFYKSQAMEIVRA